MCHDKTFTAITKHCPKKTNKSPCTVFFKAKMKFLPRVTTVDTTNLQQGELIHMESSFYNVTYIQGPTSMLNIVLKKTIMLWIFINKSKQDPVRTTWFIITTLKNEKHPCRRVVVDEDGALEIQHMLLTFLLTNSEYPWKLLVEISHESTEGMNDTT